MMATFDLPRQAFEHARTQMEDDEVALDVTLQGLMQLLDDAEEEIDWLKAELAELKRRLPSPKEDNGP